MVISALVNFQVATVLLSCMAAPLNQRHQKVTTHLIIIKTHLI